jgi:cytochrome c553
MKGFWFTTLFSLTFAAVSAAHAAGDPAAGESKAAVCVACHGVAGNSVVPTWPKLAGQHDEYLYKQLMDYKAGRRVNELMSAQVVTLNEQDFADLSAYFSAQTPTAGTVDPSAAELGERIYRGGNPETGVPACTACHGPAGGGLGLAKFPRLAGQHATYTETTLKHFRDRQRANDPNAMMRGSAANMTDEEIAAVSRFIQGLSD